MIFEKMLPNKNSIFQKNFDQISLFLSICGLVRKNVLVLVLKK